MLLCSLMLTGCGTALKWKQEDVQRGDTIELEGLTLSIQKRETGQEVAPDHPEGYYDYYEPHEGYVYFIVSGQASNTSDTDILSGNITAQAVVEDETTDAKLLFLDENESAFTEKLETGETRAFKLFLIQPEQQQPPQAFVFYYNQRLEAAGKSKQYDHKTTVYLDDEMTQG